MRRVCGVTLIELVVVITITGIIATVLGSFILQPIQGYQAAVRRAELVDAAELALRRTARDIRLALPNSVRVTSSGGQFMVEMINTMDGARYRDGPGNIGHNHGPTQYRLKIDAPDNDGFNIVGTFQNISVPFNSALQIPPSRLAIYNQGVVPATACTGSGADAYSDAGCGVGSRIVLTNPAVVSFTISGDGGGDEHQILPVGGSFRFRWASPNQRVFVVDTPITYICNPGPNGTITRYWNYTISATQPTDPAASPLSDAGTQNALLTTPVSACAFSYSPGTNQRAGLVTLDITIRDNASGEQVRLLHQAHVDNSP